MTLPPADNQDPLKLTVTLVREASVTPDAQSALDIVQQWANDLGADRVERLPRGEVDNLYIRFGTKAPNLCFGGHVDVVPVGRLDEWTYAPFDADINDGWLYGRGSEDMKSGVACWMAAVAKYLLSAPQERASLLDTGSLSLLITGDEEGPATDGTLAVVDWIKETGEDVHSCLVGEPTNRDRIGDTVKVGRRGSLTAFISLYGKQGHVAYPHEAANPLHPMAQVLSYLTQKTLDKGSEHFDASSLQITTIDVGNPATNVISATAKATINIRFNDHHTVESLKSMLINAFETACVDTEVTPKFEWRSNADAFLCPPSKFAHLISDACEQVTGTRPEYSTSGGTSDARFIKDIANVAEFGMIGRTMHQVDERIWVKDLEILTQIYSALIERFMNQQRDKK